jgi:hypothetical protein
MSRSGIARVDGNAARGSWRKHGAVRVIIAKTRGARVSELGSERVKAFGVSAANSGERTACPLWWAGDRFNARRQNNEPLTSYRRIKRF